MEATIRHDKDNKRFFCVFDGKESLLEYDEVSSGVLNFYHTYVHPDFRGKGLGEKLVLAAAEYARKSGFLVIPGCSFVALIFSRHLEFCDILETEHGPGKEIVPSCQLPKK